MSRRNAAIGSRSTGVPMFDKATGRVVAVIVLLVAVAASLRGYLPGVERATRQGPPSSGASLVYVAALLSVSLVIVAVALITRLRDPRKAAASAGGLSDRFGGSGGRPAWRVVMIGAAVLVVWLLLVWLLSQFIVLHGVDQSQPAPQSSAPAPANNAPRPPGPPDAGADRDVLRYLIAEHGGVAGDDRRGRGCRRASTSGREQRIAAAATARRPDVPRSPPSRWRGQPKAGWPKSRTSAANREQAIIACYAAMERELASFSRSRSTGFRHPDRGFGSGRRTPRAARRQCRRAGELVRRGAVQPTCDERGASRKCTCACCSWSSPNAEPGMKKLVVTWCFPRAERRAGRAVAARSSVRAMGGRCRGAVRVGQRAPGPGPRHSNRRRPRSRTPLRSRCAAGYPERRR